MAWPIILEEDKAAVLDCLDNRKLWRGDGGGYLPALERDFATLHDAKYGLAVTNGTHALEIALRAVNVRYGDVVLVPAYTFVSTASAVLTRNALPLPVDALPHTYCMDPEALERAITPETKAIIVVHIGGHPCDMPAILAIARRHGLSVIEDCAQAHGAACAGKPVGSWGDISTFSFQAGKAMTAGEGGFVLTNSESLWERAYNFMDCGRPSRGPATEYTCVASNYRMPELIAALLHNQIRRLDKQTRQRAASASYLTECLASERRVTPQSLAPYCSRHTFSMYILRCAHAQARDALVESLRIEGYETNVAHKLFYQTQMFRQVYEELPHLRAVPHAPDYERCECPIAEQLTRDALWIRHGLLLEPREALNGFVEALLQCVRTVG